MFVRNCVIAVSQNGTPQPIMKNETDRKAGWDGSNSELQRFCYDIWHHTAATSCASAFGKDIHCFANASRTSSLANGFRAKDARPRDAAQRLYLISFPFRLRTRFSFHSPDPGHTILAKGLFCVLNVTFLHHFLPALPLILSCRFRRFRITPVTHTPSLLVQTSASFTPRYAGSSSLPQPPKIAINHDFKCCWLVRLPKKERELLFLFPLLQLHRYAGFNAARFKLPVPATVYDYFWYIYDEFIWPIFLFLAPHTMQSSPSSGASRVGSTSRFLGITLPKTGQHSGMLLRRRVFLGEIVECLERF